ncbi:MAG: FAD-dependent oxidoreductase [Candidatus Saccharimonadales bacterium]|jgi:thioredoxin reductase (NADPH)
MSEVILYGATWCAYCQSLKKFLTDANQSFVYKDVDDGEEIVTEMLNLTDQNYLIPTVVINGQVYQNPSHQEMANMLNLKIEIAKKVDVLIIGGGPSGLSSAIYTSREDLKTLIIEKGAIGGLAAITDQIDNYPGFEDGVTGVDFADKLEKQAERFGAKIDFGEVVDIQKQGDRIQVSTTEGDIEAKAVLISTGSSYKKLGVPGEEEYLSRGVHYCATCDGAFYRDKVLAVIGGGNSAVQEALFLTRFTSHIKLLVRSEIKASEVLIKELNKAVEAGKITVHKNVSIKEIVGDGSKVTHIDGTQGSKSIKFDVDGTFIFIGLDPNTKFLKYTDVQLDEYGFVNTDLSLMTNIPGVFASGDVRSGATMQIASAAGEGATAALNIRKYIESLKK